jgi:hypothetical protein
MRCFKFERRRLEGKLEDSFHCLCIVFVLRWAVPPSDAHKKMPFVKQWQLHSLALDTQLEARVQRLPFAMFRTSYDVVRISENETFTLWKEIKLHKLLYHSHIQVLCFDRFRVFGGELFNEINKKFRYVYMVKKNMWLTVSCVVVKFPLLRWDKDWGGGGSWERVLAKTCGLPGQRVEEVLKNCLKMSIVVCSLHEMSCSEIKSRIMERANNAACMGDRRN